jgi:hypothetical protein
MKDRGHKGFQGLNELSYEKGNAFSLEKALCDFSIIPTFDSCRAVFRHLRMERFNSIASALLASEIKIIRPYRPQSKEAALCEFETLIVEGFALLVKIQGKARVEQLSSLSFFGFSYRPAWLAITVQ